MKKAKTIVLVGSCTAFFVVACMVCFLLGGSSGKDDDTETTAYISAENATRAVTPTRPDVITPEDVKGMKDFTDRIKHPTQAPTVTEPVATQPAATKPAATKPVETTEDVIDAIRDEIIKHVDFKDMSLDDAMIELIALGLKSENIKSRAQNGDVIILPSNWKVVDYEIEGGGQLKRSSVIHLICVKIEKPEKKYAMPDVRGMSLDKAISKLKKAGFKNIEYTSNNGKAVILEGNWTVITQNCRPDSELAASTEIKLTVAKTAPIPNVVGMSLDQAIKKLEKAGFTEITYKSDNGKSIIMKSNWTVVKQNYSEGTLVVLEDEIQLVVTK